MNLDTNYASIFGNKNPQTFSVIKTRPFGKDWYVVVDHVSKRPGWEGEDFLTARKIAESNMQISDLAFIANCAINNSSSFAKKFDGPDLRLSEDGLEILSEKLVKNSFSVSFDETVINYAVELNKDWKVFNDFLFQTFGYVESENNDRCILIEFSSESNNDCNLLPNYQVLLNLAAGTQHAIGVVFINNDDYGSIRQEFQRTLNQCFPDSISGVIVDEVYQGDKFNPEIPLLEKVKEKLIGSRFVAIQGGRALQVLADRKPWMVEVDADGLPLPLRIQVLDADEGVKDFGEAAFEKIRIDTSAIAVRECLTDLIRNDVIKAQEKVGITMGQAMGNGRAFSLAFESPKFALEIMVDKVMHDLPGGRRTWLNYRLWVEGELVLDVHPGNAAQYKYGSYSPGPRAAVGLDEASPTLLPADLGEMLSAVLTSPSELDYDDDVAMKAALREVPRRVLWFFDSQVAEEIRSIADDLREGALIIVDKKPVPATLKPELDRLRISDLINQGA